MRSILRKLSPFKKSRPKKPDQIKAILIFAHTGDVIRAERLLKEKGKPVRAVGPPPDFRKGCDLALEVPVVEQPEILDILNAANIRPVDVIATGGTYLRPTELFQVKHFGKYVMVRAANMKITIDKDRQVIVNVSGGGCPDVPYLAKILIGKTIDQAPDPLQIGRTLCGYTLGLAFREAKRLCSQ